MCGILFTNKLTRSTRRILPYLAFAMENRGDDSWGFTDGNEVHKYANAISDNFLIPKQEWNDRPFICHTRAMSVGKVSQPNAHPFEFFGEDMHRVIGIHNGSMSNWTEMNTKYGRNLEVDSMHIFAHLAEKKSVADLHMRGVVVWVENNDGIIHYARSSSTAIEIAQLDTGELIGCSEGIPLERAIRMAQCKTEAWWKTDDEFEYTIEQGQVFKGDKIPFWSHTEPATRVTSNAFGYQRYQPGAIPATYTGNLFNKTRGDYTKCPFCASHLFATRREFVLCEDCLEKIVEVIDKVEQAEEGRLGTNSMVSLAGNPLLPTIVSTPQIIPLGEFLNLEAIIQNEGGSNVGRVDI